MKKNDLQYDPFREGILKIVKAINKNLTQYLLIFIFLVSAVVLFIFFSQEKNINNPLQCLDLDFLTVSSIKEYCDTEETKKILESYKNKKISTLEGGISFIYELRNIAKENRLEKLNSINISNFKNNLIQSKLYKIKGDLIADEGLFLESIDEYLKANRSYHDKKTFSGLVFYKISQAYFLDFSKNGTLKSLNNANTYINKSLKCDVGNDAILEAIEILAARINYEI